MVWWPWICSSSTKRSRSSLVDASYLIAKSFPKEAELLLASKTLGKLPKPKLSRIPKKLRSGNEKDVLALEGKSPDYFVHGRGPYNWDQRGDVYYLKGRERIQLDFLNQTKAYGISIWAVHKDSQVLGNHGCVGEKPS